MRTPKILFLLADGARARLVIRAGDTGDFKTIEEFDGRRRLEEFRAMLRTNTPLRSFEAGAFARHGGERGDGGVREAKQAFVAAAAETAAHIAREHGYEGVFVAAPSRLIGPLRRRLSEQVDVVGALVRDLTRTPDAQLRQWLPEQPMAPA